MTKLGKAIIKEYLYGMKKAAIYARVSTHEKGQDPETQLMQLREYVDRRGFNLVGEFVDYASGTTENRDQYQAMLDLVRKRKLDVVLVWRYDRFARSTQALVNSLKEFQSLGVDLFLTRKTLIPPRPKEN